jgi:hypothetical protein
MKIRWVGAELFYTDRQIGRNRHNEAKYRLSQFCERDTNRGFVLSIIFLQAKTIQFSGRVTDRENVCMYACKINSAVCHEVPYGSGESDSEFLKLSNKLSPSVIPMFLHHLAWSCRILQLTTRTVQFLQLIIPLLHTCVRHAAWLRRGTNSLYDKHDSFMDEIPPCFGNKCMWHTTQTFAISVSTDMLCHSFGLHLPCVLLFAMEHKVNN